MRISCQKTNRIPNALEFALGRPSLSWVVDETGDKRQVAARVVVAGDLDCEQSYPTAAG